jgi:mannosyltransferase OCH1-like enzyme
MIPKIIHQIWFNIYNQKSNKIPKKFIKEQKKLIYMNKNFKYNLWTLHDAIILIKKKYKKYLVLFNSFINIVEKVDFFKYILMYEFGGIYLDIDIKSIKPLFSFINNIKTSIVISEHEYVPIYSTYFAYQNCVLLSISKQKFWKILCNNIYIWKPSIISLISNNFKIVDTTGTIMIRRTYNNYINKNNITIISPDYFINKSEKSYIQHIGENSWINIENEIILILFIIIFTVLIIYIYRIYY